MDYKEKYEQAIKRANAILEVADNREEAFGYVSTIFPELVGIEDERIRKEIHIYLDWLDGRKGYAPKGVYSIKDMIAWLEKQVSPDMVADAYLRGCNDTEKKWLEKQDVQNLANSAKTCKNEQNDQTNFTEFEEALADVCRGWIGEEIGWEDYIKTNADALRKISFKIWNKVQDVPFEQKPAWSKEDEEELGIAIKSLQQAGQLDSATWLKSLRERLSKR